MNVPAITNTSNDVLSYDKFVNSPELPKNISQSIVTEKMKALNNVPAEA